MKLLLAFVIQARPRMAPYRPIARISRRTHLWGQRQCLQDPLQQVPPAEGQSGLSEPWSLLVKRRLHAANLTRHILDDLCVACERIDTDDVRGRCSADRPKSAANC